MKEISQLNREIIKFYDKEFENLDIILSKYAIHNNKEYYPDLVPMFYKDFVDTKNKILFVGINPSFSKSAHLSIDQNIFKYSLFREKSKEEKINIINELIKLQEGLTHGNQNNIKQIQYFKQLDSFSNKIGFNKSWNHFDLFPNRCTDQNIFTKAIIQNEFNDYKNSCINRFCRIVHENEFKAVFILNKASSLFLLENLKNLKIYTQYNEFKNPSYGFYYLNKTPFILFKQLSHGATSKRELDLFVEITKYHLNKI